MLDNREARVEMLTWVGTIGTILGVIVAALPIIPKSAISAPITASSAVGLVVVAGGLGLRRVARQMREPDTVLLEDCKELTILDTAGKQATMVRKRTYVATREVSQWMFAISMKSDRLD